MKQINQKAISAKVDVEVFAKMELFCKLNNMKRNRLINLALNEYMSNHKVWGMAASAAIPRTTTPPTTAPIRGGFIILNKLTTINES